MSLTQTQLGAALGLSQAAISQSVAKGMPTHSIAAARAWREANLDPARAKPAPRAPSLSALLEEAEALLDVGGDIGPLMPDLRLALRQVPDDQRAAVAMSVDLWHVLVKHVADACEPERGAALTPAKADEMGVFWFSMAAGEPWMP